MKPYLGICLILVTLAAIAAWTLHGCTAAADRTVKNVRDAFRSVLAVQPQITVNQKVIQTQTAPVAELAVVTRMALVSLDSQNSLQLGPMPLPWTEKKMSVEATYRFKAGFDLHQPFSIAIDPKTKKIDGQLPHAKILSVDQIGDVVYKGEDAPLFNRITDEDRNQILNELHNLARDRAENSGLKQEAERQVVARLQELIGDEGNSLRFQWTKIDSTHSPPIP